MNDDVRPCSYYCDHPECIFHAAQIDRVRKMLGPFNRHSDARIEWDVNDAVQEIGILREAIDAYEEDAEAYRSRIAALEDELAKLKARIAEAPLSPHMRRRLLVGDEE